MTHVEKLLLLVSGTGLVHDCQRGPGTGAAK
jgi:hypothetical protein